MSRYYSGYSQQKGLSTAGWMIAVALFGFFLTLILKLSPAYIENMGLRSAMKSMVNKNPDLHTMSKNEIYRQLSNYFTINGVRNHRPEDMSIDRQRDRTLINHSYETRIPLFFNVDAMLTFRNQIDSSNLKECCKYLVEVEDPKKPKAH